MDGEVTDEWDSNRAKWKMFANGSFSFRAGDGIIFRERDKFRTFFRMRRGNGDSVAPVRTARQKLMQRRARLRVQDTVDALRTEVALKGGDDLAGVLVESSGRRDFVAVSGEHFLRGADFLAAIADAQGLAAQRPRGAHPVADAVLVKLGPGKFLAGVPLARGRNIGMSEHSIGADFAALDDVLAERDYRPDLLLRKIRVAEIVTGISDLDSDRARIYVAPAFP